jgi:hypothetical protein
MKLEESLAYYMTGKLTPEQKKVFSRIIDRGDFYEGVDESGEISTGFENKTEDKE